jgi:hypothetical protein
LNAREIYLFNKDFSSYNVIDLSGKVENIIDICYEAAIHNYYLLDSGNQIRIFDSNWSEIDQCDVSNLAPRGFSNLTKITSGDLRDNFALLNRNDLEIVVINFKNQKAVSRLENLIEEIQKSLFQQGFTIREHSVEYADETSLIKKLENAIHSIELENINAAIHEIMAFQNEVQAQKGEKIPADLADDWINKAEQIIRILRD